MQFKRIETIADVLTVSPYLNQSGIRFCDYTAGVRYMWREEYRVDYAFVGDTLVMKETTDENRDTFFPPIGRETERALAEIERYAKEHCDGLRFGYLDNAAATAFSHRYPFVRIYSDRNWSDYLYRAEDMKYFRGKKLSGQRNHLNKFRKLYPNAVFSEISEDMIPSVREMLSAYEAENAEPDESERAENRHAAELLECFRSLGLCAGCLTLDGKVIAFCIGEVGGDTLTVHVEKGLRQYEGVYQAMVSSFTQRFADPSVRYTNREEDCGDQGLRISKMQYHPVGILEKNYLLVQTCFDRIGSSACFSSERLSFSLFAQRAGEFYRALAADEALNRLWGYDYREDIPEREATAERFAEFLRSLYEKKEECSFIVRLGDRPIGEIVLHNFDYYGGVEIGCRIVREEQKKGYGSESFAAAALYAKERLKAKKCKAKCLKENEASRRMILSAGFRSTGADAVYYYFERENETGLPGEIV